MPHLGLKLFAFQEYSKGKKKWKPYKIIANIRASPSQPSPLPSFIHPHLSNDENCLHNSIEFCLLLLLLILYVFFLIWDFFVGFSLKLKLITFNEIDSFDEIEVKCRYLQE